MGTDWLEGRARITPNRRAVKDNDTRECWTYRQLNTRAYNLASHLLSIGVNKGDRVVLFSPNHISYFDFLFACTKIGAIFVPINWRLCRHEIESILEDCSPKCIALPMEKEYEVSNYSYHKIFINSEEYDLLLNKTISHMPFETVKEEDPAVILYTSGSTGKPKGVLLLHRMLLSNAYNTILSWNIKETDVTLTITPMFHTAGLFALTIPILMSGGQAVIIRKYDANETIQLINDEKCTLLFMVPTMYHIMIQSPLFSESNFNSMRTFISGGSPCPRSIYKAFEKKGLNFKEAYGMTEAGPNNFYIDPETARRKIGSIGLPMMFIEVKIILENGIEAEPEQIGEVVISGAHLFACYWNNLEETNKVLKDGQFHTGDLGKKDKDGYFYIVGRKKELIISGGENIYPLEIEHVLHEHPAVNENAVIGLPDEKWGEIVAAIVSLKPSYALQEEELKCYCREVLAGYKIPRKIFFVDKLPKNGAGKIDKKQIVEICRSLDSLFVS